MKAVLVRHLFTLSEGILYRVPIIKTVYRAIRDLFEFFSPKKEGFGKVVIVKFNNKEIIGFITQEDPERLPESFRHPDSVLVYIPMSYMIGGYTLFLPRSCLTPLDIPFEQAMRLVLTGAVTKQRDDITKPGDKQ